MSLATLIDRADDWINPIVIKELRQAVKSRAVLGILMGFLGLQLFILGAVLLFREMRGDTNATDWNAGSTVFCIQQGILLAVLMVLVPAYAAIRLAAERSDHNVDLLFISTLHPRSIIWGKLFAALMLALLVYSTCAPFMTFTYLMRGIDIPTIATILVIDLLAMLMSTMAALFLASLPGNRILKFFFCFVGFVFIFIVCLYMIGATVALVNAGVGILDEVFDVGIVTGVTVAGILGLVGLLFWYSVALISPPSSNRILPVRIYVTLLWAGMGTAFYLTSLFYPSGIHMGPIIAWVVCGTLLVCAQFLISTCERESWGPRLARTIPRWLIFRPFAFLFYTGAAGGITLSTAMGLITLGGSLAWNDWFTGSRGEDGLREVIVVFGTIAGYVYCYGLTAVLFRAYLLANQIRTSFTWLILLLLVGVGSSIPSMIALIFFQNQVRMGGDTSWWFLSNPFYSVYEVTPSGPWASRSDTYTILCMWFLGTWGMLVTILATPWYILQCLRFHPPRQRNTVLAAVEVVETPAPAPSMG